MKTAKEYLKELDKESGGMWTESDESICSALIEFAKLHVKAALEAASKNGFATRDTKLKGYRDLVDGKGNKFGKPVPMYSEEYIINKNSILNAYPESNIK